MPSDIPYVQIYGQLGTVRGPAAFRGTSNVSTVAGGKISFAPGISVGLDFQQLSKIFRVGFVNRAIGAALADAHAKMAKDIQKAQIDDLRLAIISNGRPQRPGQRFEKAWLDERNALIRPNNLVVGVEAHMKTSDAKRYYRVIAEGLEIPNRTVYGYFTKNPSGFTTFASSAGKSGTNAAFSQANVFAAEASGKPQPEGKDARLMFGQNARGKKWRITYSFFGGYNFAQRGFAKWYTSHDPMTYYQEAFARQGLDVATEWRRGGGTALPITKEPVKNTLSQVSRRGAARIGALKRQQGLYQTNREVFREVVAKNVEGFEKSANLRRRNPQSFYKFNKGYIGKDGRPMSDVVGIGNIPSRPLLDSAGKPFFPRRARRSRGKYRRIRP